MKFEVTVEDDLLTKAFNYCIPVQSVFTEALWTAVKAAESAQELGEGVEPVEAEEASQDDSDAPYAVTRDWYEGSSYRDWLHNARLRNRKAFGRRARLTLIPDGKALVGPEGKVSGAIIVEVRRAKRTS